MLSMGSQGRVAVGTERPRLDHRQVARYPVDHHVQKRPHQEAHHGHESGDGPPAEGGRGQSCDPGHPHHTGCDQGGCHSVRTSPIGAATVAPRSVGPAAPGPAPTQEPVQYALGSCRWCKHGRRGSRSAPRERSQLGVRRSRSIQRGHQRGAPAARGGGAPPPRGSHRAEVRRPGGGHHRSDRHRGPRHPAGHDGPGVRHRGGARRPDRGVPDPCLPVRCRGDGRIGLHR